MIRRYFLFARILIRLSRVFSVDIHSKVRTFKPPVRVTSQSYHPEKKSQFFMDMLHVVETRSVACGEDESSLMEENNNSVSTQQQQQQQHQSTAKKSRDAGAELNNTTKGETCSPDPEFKGGKKVKKAKKDRKKWSAKKKKENEAQCTDSLMAELPFANTEIWKELGFASSESSVKKKRKRGESGRVGSEEDGDGKKKKKKETARPNYFVSVPITNPKIKQTVEDLQNLVIEKDSRLSRALIPVNTLHITLLVTHLSTQEQVDLAASTLSDLESTLSALLAGRSLILPFCGVGHFKQEVAFVQIAEGEHLSTLTHMAEMVRKGFEERGIASGDDKAFKPHLTFLKLSRAPKLRKQGIKKLDPSLFSEFESAVFGDECVCRVDLCSMLKKKTPDGYYHCQKSVTFSVKKGPPPDDEELVSLSKRLVEDAVFRAVQQYMEETQQNGKAPKDEAPDGKLNTTK
ncbi:A-kinase anchor protein 7 isoform X3 [Myxocyprinus asiaticus]|uniref:A-kinase anchor protein 7 isoform X3 n=1 Tax=Myxocyprinus asiaticus TaxID=70543 RepID=UPI00222288DE|nr:A-kinase anchor protein 7 isoform X3 [Myxocyprinus asiaticus]